MVLLQPKIKVFVAVSIMALQFSRESYFAFPDATLIEAILPQELNALPPMLVTLFPIITEVRPEHQPNALPPMLVTLLGMVTEVRPEHLQNASNPIVVTLFGIVTDERL